MLVLAIDASTYSGSVALIRDHSVSGEAVVAMRGEHEERLMPAVAGLLSQNSVAVDRLDAVAGQLSRVLDFVARLDALDLGAESPDTGSDSGESLWRTSAGRRCRR